METTKIVEISPNEIEEQNKMEHEEKVRSGVSFDPKNYLNTRLSPGEMQKTLTIRLLPFTSEGGTPFNKIKAHMVRVNKELSASGWKTFVCPKTINEEDACPFCETSKEAYTRAKSETDATKKDQLQKMGLANLSQDMWIVRCIDRDHEEDGPKFWRFTSSRKHKGIYDMIMSIYYARKNEGERVGQKMNIFDLENGKDLVITITKGSDGKQTTTVVDSGFISPLSKDEEVAERWINDSKKWTDVFGVKPYDYMSIVIEGGVPIRNQDTGKYEPKLSAEEYEKKKSDEINSQLTKIPEKFAEKPSDSGEKDSLKESVSEKAIGEEDLPF